MKEPVEHDIEIYANEACTQRPVTGQSYTKLYAWFNKDVDMPEETTISVGSAPNSFSVSNENMEAQVIASFGFDFASTEPMFDGIPEGKIVALEAYSSTSLDATIFSYDIPT